jgi:hypothetical protein
MLQSEYIVLIALFCFGSGFGLTGPLGGTVRNGSVLSAPSRAVIIPYIHTSYRARFVTYAHMHSSAIQVFQQTSTNVHSPTTPRLLYSCTPLLLYSSTPLLLYSPTPLLLYCCTPVFL